MDFQPILHSFPFSVSAGNSSAALIFWISLFIVLILIIRILLKKLRTGENLKYEFITIIAHKFRTPLTQVKWMTDELIKAETDAYKKEKLIAIQNSNERLIKLTGTMIELTDSDSQVASSYAFERMSVCSFARTIGESCKDAFHGKNVFFSVQCPDEDVFSKIDPQRMEFVLQTILENALNFTPPGKDVQVVVQKVGRKAVVSVKDTGIGIDPKDMEHVFSKFFRAENAQTVDTEGFGVGLYLSRSIVRKHKGEIQAQSEGVGAGSIFSIILPATR